MKRKILFLIILLSLTITSYEQSAPSQKTTVAKSFAEIKFDSTHANLGIIRGDTTAFIDFKFTNSGNRPLLITEVKGSCHCVQGKWPKKAIAPGESGVINVSLGPEGITGLFIRTIAVRSNARQSVLDLGLSGEIKPGTETKGPH